MFWKRPPIIINIATLTLNIEIPARPGPTESDILGAINEGFEAMSDASDRLAREVQETRDAVTALTGRYQSKIDAMQVEIDNLKAALANGDTEAASAAADALDALQTEMSNLATTPQPAEPVAEQPAPEGGATE